MAVSGLFAPRPDNNRVETDIVGTFRSGMVVRRQPKALSEWRVTTDSADVAESIEEMFGGETSENESDTESLQVLTTSKSVDVIYESIDTGFSVWASNKLVRTCNGETQLSGDEAGQPCLCAGMDLDARKQFANKGGCSPAIRVVFRLANAEELGRFQFRSGAWSLLGDIQAVEAKVDQARDADKTVSGRIELEQITTKAGRVLTLPRVTIKR